MTADTNEGLISKWAGRYADETDPLRSYADLWQEGYLGLMEAVRKYRPSSGRPWPKFASGHIRGAVRKAATGVARCGAAAGERDVKLRAAYARTAKEMGGASEDEVIAAMGLTAFVAARLRAGNALMDAAPVPVERLAKLESAAGSGAGEEAERLLGLATYREREYLSARYGVGRPAEARKELAKRVGVAPAVVSAVCASGIKRIRLHAED